MRLFRPWTSFFCPRALSPRPSAFPCFPPSRLSSSSGLCPSRFFIDSNLFHLPPVRSSQHHPGLVPIPLGDIRPCCLHLPSFCRFPGPPAVTSSPVFATARCRCPRLSPLAISCSRAPAAIVPSQEPESRDAGVSRNAGIGSHLAATGFSNGQEAVL